jgi:hypothetical protein
LGALLRRLCLKLLVLLKSKGTKMPVNKPMMKSMKESYGKKKGESVYYAVEAKQKKAMPMRGERTAKNKAKKMK